MKKKHFSAPFFPPPFDPDAGERARSPFPVGASTPEMEPPSSFTTFAFALPAPDFPLPFAGFSAAAGAAAASTSWGGFPLNAVARSCKLLSCRISFFEGSQGNNQARTALSLIPAYSARHRPPTPPISAPHGRAKLASIPVAWHTKCAQWYDPNSAKIVPHLLGDLPTKSAMGDQQS